MPSVDFEEFETLEEIPSMGSPGSKVPAATEEEDEEREEGEYGEEEGEGEETASAAEGGSVEIHAPPSNWNGDPVSLLNSEEDEAYGAKVRKRIGQLKAAGSELQRQREALLEQNRQLAAARAADAAKLAELNKKLRADSIKSLEYQVAQAEASKSLAEKKLRDAFNQASVDEVTKANAEFADAANMTARAKEALERGKSEIAAEAAAPAQQQQVVQTQPPVRISQQTQDWVSRNPWFNPNGGDAMSNHAIAVHKYLVSQGIDDSNPSYIATIDHELRKKFPSQFAGSQSVSRGATPPPARAHQQGNSNNSPVMTKDRNGKLVFNFTPEQKAYCKKFGFRTETQLKAYASEIIKARKQEGR